MEYHRSVLIDEVLELLQVEPGKKFIDATIGDAGQAIAIAKKGGLVLGIDWDKDAILRSQQRIGVLTDVVRQRITLVQDNFVHLEKTAKAYGFTMVDGILFDLGASTYQLTEPRRGFSLRKKGPLDMRMDRRQKFTAWHLVNTASEEELYEIFTKFSQEKHSRAIARAIVSTRALVGSIQTTDQLVNIVSLSVLGRRGNLHLATPVFQALRIAINDELSNLRQVLPQAVKLLKKTGRLAIISFHSGEDRIVKLFFRQEKRIRPVTKRIICPSINEIWQNPRARSARLRIGEKI